MNEQKLSAEVTSQVLIQALPYIQKYKDKTIVIKYGGNAMINEELKDAVMGDIVLLSAIGIKVVLVHGGGPEITDMLRRVGKKSEFVDGLRVTDRETAEIVQMVLAGKVNKSLVDLVTRKGGRAIGLCGIDGGMIRARAVDSRLGYVGEITDIDTRPIADMLERGYIPIISTVGSDGEGNVYNINADTGSFPDRGSSPDGVSHYYDGCARRASGEDRPGYADFQNICVRHLASCQRRGTGRGDDSQGGLLQGRHPPRRRPSIYHRRPSSPFYFD